MIPSDLAESAAENLRKDHLAALERQEISLDETSPMVRDAKKIPFGKIQFSWRTEDRLILEQIKVAAQKLFEEMFTEVITLMDEQQRAFQNWDQVTGDEIEKALLALQRYRFMLGPEVNNLMLEAVYARQVSEDKYHDSWGKVMDGTQGDKVASASRNSREDKYHAFFRFHLYSTADAFYKEFVNFMRLLEKSRDWRARTQYR